MSNRAIVYAYQNPGGRVTIINYAAENNAVNTFLSHFEVWDGNGQFQLSADGEHQEVRFECVNEMWNMLHTGLMHTIFERMDVALVFEEPI